MAAFTSIPDRDKTRQTYAHIQAHIHAHILGAIRTDASTQIGIHKHTYMNTYTHTYNTDHIHRQPCAHTIPHIQAPIYYTLK